MIIKVETSDKLLATASNLYLTTLQPIINQKDANEISNAIKNSLPAPNKLDTIRKEISNGFKYSFDFTETTNDVFKILKEIGEISGLQTTNVSTIEIKLNGNIVSVPFTVAYGDELIISIQRTNPLNTAQVVLEAQEFNGQEINTTVTDGLDQFEGYEIDINPDLNVTYSEFDSGFSIETNINVAQLQADSIVGTPAFSTDDIGREVILELPGGNQTVKITAFNSADNVTIDQLPNETAQGVSFKYKRVASIGNCGTLGGEFEENTPTLQPYIYKEACNGHDAIQFTNGPRLVFNKLHPNEFTLFVVVKSFDERTTGAVANSICGDINSSSGFWLIAEWGNPAQEGITTYGRIFWANNTSSFSTIPLRDRFHLITVRFKQNNATLQVDQNSKTNFNPINIEISHSPVSFLTIGNVAPSFPYTGRTLIPRFIFYRDYKKDDEVTLIQQRLKVIYNI